MQAVVGRGGENRRHDVRYRADIPCRLLWDDGEEPGTLRDMSCHGVMIRGFYMPPVGTRVTIIADWLEVIGTVAWLGDDRAGILLSHEIDPIAHLQHPAHDTRTLFFAH